MSAAKLIGTRKEKSLHAALKRRYAGESGLTEAPVGQYVCDAIREDGEIIEVQTGNFSSIRQKLDVLTKQNRVVLVHPIPYSRTIELRGKDGAIIHTRKSPKKGTAWDLFTALVRAPLLPLMPGLSIELVLVEETELRVDDGEGSWRRKGISIADRRLDSVRDTVILENAADYRRFLPDILPRDFTVKELAAAAPVRKALAGKAIYVLKRIGLIEETGKRGNAKLYSKTY